MPISSEIQFYVDNEFLSMESAQQLTLDQIQMLSNYFIKRIISTKIYPVEFLLTEIDPEGKKQAIQIATCIEDYINEGLLSKDEVDDLPIEHCIILGQLFIHDLLLSHKITIAQALQLDVNYAMALDDLSELITCGKLSCEQAWTFTSQQVMNLNQVRKLVLHEVIPLEEAIDLTVEKLSRLRLLHFMAQLSFTRMSLNHNNVLNNALDPWHDYFDDVDAVAAINKVRTLIANKDLDVLFTAPLGTLTFQCPLSGRACDLFFNNKLPFQVLVALTIEQRHKLDCDGVYDLLLHNHLNIDQIFDLTQGQCYQLDDPTIRAQIIAGELELAAIPEPDIAAIVPVVMNGPVNINGQQSTHTASVHRTVSESATKLLDRYGAQLDGLNLDTIIATINTWAHALPPGNFNDTAKRCVERLTAPHYTYSDVVSDVSTRQLLALSWIAVHDDSLRISSLADAEKQFCTGLYEIQREYNLSETGIDLGGEDLHACSGGTFNKLMEKLVNIHPDVHIEFITMDTATLKFKTVIKDEANQYLCKRANPLTLNSFLSVTNHLKQLEKDGVEVIWDDIKYKVATRMFEEFHSLFVSKDDAKFTDFIDAGQYLEMDRLPSFQKMLFQSKGYQQYCSTVLRASGIFSGLIRQRDTKESEDLIQPNQANL